MVGKWHLCAAGRDEPGRVQARTGRSAAGSTGSTASSARRPTSGIRTWSTTTTRSTRPARPAEGYHLSVDLTDKAIEFIDDVKTIAPDRPVFLYYALGCRARAAPRAAGVGRPVQGPVRHGLRGGARADPRPAEGAGHRPAGHRAAADQPDRHAGGRAPGPDGKPFPPLDYTKPWDSLSADERRLFARMAEVYAGFLSHADAQIGRLLDYLEAIDQLDNTHRSSSSPTTGPAARAARTARSTRTSSSTASPTTSPPTWPCSTSWAARRPTTTTRPAGRWRSTPRSRCGSATRSTAAPATRASSPGRPASRPAARSAHQYHHAIDLVPTVLECLGVEPARRRCEGVTQIPIQGVSMRSSFDAADAPVDADDAVLLDARHPRRSGTTAGRRSPPTRRSAAGATTSRTPGSSTTSTIDRSELHDLAAEEPERLAELVGLWFYEAGANHAFPLDDRSALEIILTPRPQLVAAARPLRLPARRRGDPRVRRGQRPQPRRSPSAPRSTCPDGGAQGVLFAHGSRFGGHALYVKDNRLHYVNNFVGITEQRVDATEDLPTGENLILSASFDKAGEDPPGHRARHAVAVLRRPQGRRGPDPDPARLVLARRRGPDRRAGTAASRSPTTTPARPLGVHRRHPAPGRRRRLREPYVDLEREAAAMLARE